MHNAATKPLLVVLATEAEASRLFPGSEKLARAYPSVQIMGSLAVCVVGVGILQTSLALGKLLSSNSYCGVLNLGVCGAYPNSGLDLCECVRVDRARVGDLGAQDSAGGFLGSAELGWPLPEYLASAPGLCAHWPNNLGEHLWGFCGVHALSVNLCSGTRRTALERCAGGWAQVEDMESVAILALAQAFQIPGAVVRSVSNPVGPRQRNAWKMAEALDKLREKLFPRGML